MRIKYLAFAIFLLPLHGKETPNRFKKTQNLPKDSNDLPTVVMASTEHIMVPKALLKKTPSYEDALTWVSNGKATIVESTFLTSRPKLSTQQISGTQLIYPTEFSPPLFPGEWPSPSSWDTRQIGHILNMQISAKPPHQLQASISLRQEIMESSSSGSALIEKTRHPDDLFFPQTRANRLRTGLRTPADKTELISFFNSPKNPNSSLLIFSRISQGTLPSVSTKPSQESVEIVAELVEIPLADWLDHSHNSTLDKLRGDSGWIEELLANKTATTRFSTQIRTHYEKPNTCIDGKTISHSLEYQRSDSTSELSPTNRYLPTSEKEHFHIGFSADLNAGLLPSGHISVKYDLEHRKQHGMNVLHRFFDGENWVPDIFTPNHSVSIQRGHTVLSPGAKTLVGVLSPTNSDGLPSSGTRLLFLLTAK